MSTDFLSILENHPCTCSVENITEKVQGYSPTSQQKFRLLTKYKDHDWKLIILIDPSFPLHLPTIEIENSEDYPAMGHINWHGDLCYKDKQGLVVNYKQPDEVLTACVYEALRTLHDNFTDPNKIELHNDFESYWESLPSNGLKTTCIVSPKETAQELIAYRDTKNERQTKLSSCLAIIEQDHNVNQYYHPLYVLKDKKKDKSIYIPLDKSITPPPPKRLWTASDIFNIFEKSTSNEVREVANKILEKHKWSNYFTLIFSHQKPDLSHCVWGVEFHRKDKAKHPLLNPKDDWKISPMQLRTHNKKYLLERCGTSISLDKKKVAIVGCGSVGGGIALQLAKAGVGELHLIDFDKMEIENIYRHVLGGTAINVSTGGHYKNDMLKWEIETNFPYTKVNSCQNDLLTFASVKEIFNYFDVIVVATGDFTSELHFNTVHKKITELTPVIYAWQDGFGIGGHAITVVNDESSGCLECLYTQSFGFEPHAKTSFIKYGQTISKHLGGCTGVFTPFSFLDASQTALLATRMTLEALQGKAKNEIRSWKGSDEQLKAEGHSASSWYKKSPDHFIQDQENYIATNCPVCGKNN